MTSILWYNDIFNLFIFSSKQQYALAANDPGEYVMKMTKSAIDTLTNQSISQEEKENQFGKLFDKAIHFWSHWSKHIPAIEKPIGYFVRSRIQKFNFENVVIFVSW